MAKKSKTGNPIRGNPRRPSDAMMGANEAIPLGGRSIVTKQFWIASLARHSDSLDSISDEEDNRRGGIVRSHIKPNKNWDPFAEIRAQRIAQPPHDHTKPAVMKHPDLPSKPMIPNRFEGGSGRKNSYCSSGSLSTLSTISTVSDLRSSSDSYSSNSKIGRFSTVTPKMEMKEEPAERSVKKEVNDKPCKSGSSVSEKETKMIEVEMKREVEVDTHKLRTKREIKEETMNTKEERSGKDFYGPKIKKARPAEELVRERKMLEVKREETSLEVKREIKDDDIITID